MGSSAQISEASESPLAGRRSAMPPEREPSLARSTCASVAGVPPILTPLAFKGRCGPVLAVSALLTAAGALVLFCFDPRAYPFYPRCFLHQTTGLLCPGCGALRALHQLLHGHWATAFQFNPMVIALLPVLGWMGAKLSFQTARNEPASLGVRPLWWWLLLAAVLVVSVLRNVPGSGFALLRP